MKFKKIIIIALITIFLIMSILSIIKLWKNGVIPQHIAKISATIYFKIRCPKMHLKCIEIEWSPHHGDYIIHLVDINNNPYSCVMTPKYFPILPGQGEFGITEYYDENYKNK